MTKPRRGLGMGLDALFDASSIEVEGGRLRRCRCQPLSPTRISPAGSSTRKSCGSLPTPSRATGCFSPCWCATWATGATSFWRRAALARGPSGRADRAAGSAQGAGGPGRARGGAHRKPAKGRPQPHGAGGGIPPADGRIFPHAGGGGRPGGPLALGRRQHASAALAAADHPGHGAGGRAERGPRARAGRPSRKRLAASGASGL